MNTTTRLIHPLHQRLAALCLALLCATAVSTARAASYIITTTADSGPGSLRQAMIDNNADDFGFGGIGVITFNIDASTDPGCDTNTGVCTIQPLSPLPVVGAAIRVDGYTQSGASPNTLTNDDNAVLKIVLDGSKAGTFANGFVHTNGLYESTVRGLVINQFDGAGIELRSTGFRPGDFEVTGCFIGTDATGTKALGNRVGADASIVGGTTPDARNLISGNTDLGLFLFDTEVQGVAQGNFIGTDRHGTAALGNVDGVKMSDSSLLGGADPAARNVISGNTGKGVIVNGALSGTGGNPVVEGNLIGVDVTGAVPLGNGDAGVYLDGALNATIGGLTAAGDNIIAYNGGAGIQMVSSFDETLNNLILRNSIFCNGGLGINLCIFPCPYGEGNHGQTAPVVSAAPVKGGKTKIQGTLNSLANTSYLLQLYTSTECGSGSHAQGQTFLGFLNVTTGANSNASFTDIVSALAPGLIVTATATDPSGNTSAFSTSTDLALSTRANLATVKSGQNLTYTLVVTNRGPDAASTVVVNDPLPAGTSFVGATATQGSLVTPLVGATGTVTNSLDALNAGASATVTITVKTTALGSPKGKVTLTNTASVTAFESDLNPLNNVASVTTSVTGK